MNERETLEPALPAGSRLLPGERIVQCVEVSPRIAPLRNSAIREIYRLTHATKKTEVGAYGPAIASLAFEGPASEQSEHQNKYSVVFGRDSLRVALDLIDDYPQLAEATIRRLAQAQGTEEDVAREEEFGKIAHEIRDPNDPIAEKFTRERGWGWPYYGSADATPEFIRTLAAYLRLTSTDGSFLSQSYIADGGEALQIKDSFERSLGWIEKKLGENREGIVEFKKAIPGGTANQVWKDSPDAYHHADGQFANHDRGVSSIELEGVTHEALLDAADIYEQFLGDRARAIELRERARSLKQTIRSLYWTGEKGGYFVLGTDRDEDDNLRQLKLRTSNMGHLLNTRVLDGDDDESKEMRLAVLAQLRSNELLATSGIRTLANDEKRFREGAYHNGSVWIWDTHHVAKGARRYRTEPIFLEFADELDQRILTAVNTIGGFPEYVRGGDEIAINDHLIDVYDPQYDTDDKINRVEQPPQEIQAWTVAAVIAAKRHVGRSALLGQQRR